MRRRPPFPHSRRAAGVVACGVALGGLLAAALLPSRGSGPASTEPPRGFGRATDVGLPASPPSRAPLPVEPNSSEPTEQLTRAVAEPASFKSATIRGVVTDAFDRAPIAGASLRLLRYPRLEASAPVAWERLVELARATSGADGGFDFRTHLPPADLPVRTWIGAKKEGWHGGDSWFHALEIGELPFEETDYLVRLKPSLVLAGTVVEVRGDIPVPNATLRSANEAGASPFAVTDAGGAFRADLGSTPSLEILVGADGHAPVRFFARPAAENRDLRIVLPRLGDLPVVDGTVLDPSGAPAPDALVAFRSIPDAVAGREERSVGTEAGARIVTNGRPRDLRADAEGRFRAALPHGGVWEIEARGAGTRRVVRVAVPDAGESTCAVRLERACRVRGRIVDESGGAASAEVFFRRADWLGGVSASDGEFEIGGLDPGEPLRIWAARGALRSAEVSVALDAHGLAREVGTLALRAR